MTDLYHCCRWCKWFDGTKGVCTKQTFDNVLFLFWENGDLSEAIKEGFKDFKFDELESALIESKLSKKRVTEIMKLFGEELESALMNWTESIDDSVSTALNNYDFGRDNGVSIKDPSDFHCKHFW